MNPSREITSKWNKYTFIKKKKKDKMNELNQKKKISIFVKTNHQDFLKKKKKSTRKKVIIHMQDKDKPMCRNYF